MVTKQDNTKGYEFWELLIGSPKHLQMFMGWDEKLESEKIMHSDLPQRNSIGKEITPIK